MQFALRNPLEECAHLVVVAGHLKFHATIGKVTHPTSYVEAFGCVANGPAKPDPLHISLVQNLERNHGGFPEPCCLLHATRGATRWACGMAYSFHLYEYTRQKVPCSPSSTSTETKYWPLFAGENPAAALSPLS